MAYSTSTPPVRANEAPFTGAGQLWIHASADAQAAANTSGFITNGGDLGMKVGDIVQHRDTSTNIVTSHSVITVSSTAPGAVDLSDGVVIGDFTTNAD
jgi:hypothetical protein